VIGRLSFFRGCQLLLVKNQAAYGEDISCSCSLLIDFIARQLFDTSPSVVMRTNCTTLIAAASNAMKNLGTNGR
jgi:hypothetical protein